MLAGLTALLVAFLAISGCVTMAPFGGDYDPGDGWTLEWSDEFDDGVLDDDIWHRQIMLRTGPYPGPYNNELQRYTGDPDTAYEQDGNLVLRADRIGNLDGDGQYTSARVISNPGGQNGTSGSTGATFMYGKIAVRATLPAGKGIWPAIWMLGDNINETGGSVPWPSSGEIDILETGSVNDRDGHYGHATLHGTLHYSNSFGSHQYTGDTTQLSEGTFADDYHIFEIEWDERSIVWRLDGVPYHYVDITRADMSEFHEPHYLLFNIAVGGHFTHVPDETTQFPQFMYVDWVRHYVSR